MEGKKGRSTPSRHKSLFARRSNPTNIYNDLGHFSNRSTCPPFFAARQIPCSHILSYSLGGMILGIRGIFNACLTKQINGNYTPDRHKRNTYISLLENMHSPLLLSFIPCFSFQKSDCTLTLLNIGAVFIYDLNSKTIDPLIEKINQFTETIQNHFYSLVFLADHGHLPSKEKLIEYRNMASQTNKQMTDLFNFFH